MASFDAAFGLAQDRHPELVEGSKGGGPDEI